MPPNSHAVLSASSSHRWLNCNPSARLELEFEDRGTSAASEGTAAHALCEHKLKRRLKLRSDRPTSSWDSDEMEGYTDDYADFVMEQVIKERRRDADTQVLIEQRLDFSCFVPDGFGTGDCIIVSKGRLHIIDFKYGQGVLVEAEDNPQMKLYALGAIRQFGEQYEIKKVKMTIFQPRRENVSTWETTAAKLKRWAEKDLKPKAEKAYKGEGHYCPGEWCLFCKAAVKCRARAEEKLRIAQGEFKLPPLLTDGEIESVLAKLADIKKWAEEIQEYALAQALGGKEWAGFKLVEGRSVRKYADEEEVAKAAKSAGYKDIYKQSLITITEMEKLMGKTDFNKVLGGLIVKPQGKPTLVPDTDKRPAISVSAKNEFNEIKGEF
ncbi:MAG: DUF2800 domain-containing protein [Clostridia bacterium]|nr:DUF2800 domain-containing protein [Clostridia bacterium]